ncbi:hypothetical protein ARMSODRAFT_1086486 [Armillaria solidipes]|uniref:DUF6589 domain-containing protein n=1 Tax=Armillaria solidipes TaxID=1076256 RepID=A0A2H3B899_9AGAR|nr:hypothetical protein ARMSODRAFT_1086486 [Armillaria solidipes]
MGSAQPQNYDQTRPRTNYSPIRATTLPETPIFHSFSSGNTALGLFQSGTNDIQPPTTPIPRTLSDRNISEPNTPGLRQTASESWHFPSHKPFQAFYTPNAPPSMRVRRTTSAPLLPRDENAPPLPDTPSAQSRPSRKRRVAPSTTDKTTSTTASKKSRNMALCLEDKLAQILEACTVAGLSWAEVQYEMYRLPTAEEKASWEAPSRERFMDERSTQSPVCSTFGYVIHMAEHTRIPPEMFSSAQKAPYLTIGPVRPAMTSFAVQISIQELVSNAEKAVQPDAGLHVHIPSARRPQKKNVAEVDWTNIGSFTHKAIQTIHRQFQPLLRHILIKVMTWSNSKKRSRSVGIVADDILSKIAFTRTPFARLPAIMRGLFHFASNASFDTFRYESRVGNTPAYSMVVKALYGLSSQASKFTCNYHRRRMARIGLQNAMNVGMAGTAWIRPLRHPDALNYEDKERRRASSHQEKPTPAFPLPTSGGSETNLPELMAAVTDFMKSAGQTSDDFVHHMLLIGGDGLTFELLLKMARQRQFHSSPFTSLCLINPLLQWWHTWWTNDSRIIDKHLVSYASLDPSTLGHSASKIERTIRIDQGKYDYHQGSELLYFVLDMRMLDCWRLILSREAAIRKVTLPSHADLFQVIDALSARGQLPEIEDLEKLAAKLHATHTTEEAVFRSARGRLKTAFPPRGTPWVTSIDSLTVPSAELLASPSLLDALDQSMDGDKAKAKPDPQADCVLARSQDFMREVMRSREATWSIAEGDVGRVWEQLKAIMFSFAGSNHKKYAQYLLETLFDLEWESSPELRETLLEISVVNLSGLPGKFKPGDLVQEYFNRILEVIVQHKGREFGKCFIREGIARNLHHFQQLKTDFLEGVRLKARSTCHAKPHSKPEIAKLLKEYSQAELHMYRPGRGYSEGKVVRTDFKLGCDAMRDGLLKKWTTRMMLLRSQGVTDPAVLSSSDDADEEGELDWTSLPLYSTESQDGVLVHNLLYPTADALSIVDVKRKFSTNSLLSPYPPWYEEAGFHLHQLARIGTHVVSV